MREGGVGWCFVGFGLCVCVGGLVCVCGVAFCLLLCVCVLAGLAFRNQTNCEAWTIDPDAGRSLFSQIDPWLESACHCLHSNCEAWTIDPDAGMPLVFHG